VYLPKEKRKMETKPVPTQEEIDAKREAERLKKVRFEEEQLKKELKGNSRLQRAMEKKKMIEEAEAAAEALRRKRPPPKRKLSFSEGMMKYDDAKHLLNPIRDAKGPSIKQARTIMQMMKTQKFPVQEILLHVPDHWDFFIDSLTSAAYNSDELEAYGELEPDLRAPQNSIESLEEVDFASSSDDSVELIPKPQNRKEKI